MKPSFYTGAAGLIAHQQNLNAIGNNIANVNTVGYKDRTVSFDDLLYTTMYANRLPEQDELLTGHGVKAMNGGLKFTQGSYRETMFDLDFAVAGDALFATDMNGQRMYTRDGEFIIQLEGENAYLATGDGGHVLDKNGQRIQLQKLPGEEGYNFDAVKEQIGLYRFNNPGGLTPVRGNRYLQSEISGEAQLVTDQSSKLLHRYIENSNTVLADAMTDMIAAQRSYQVSARVLQVSDENEQTINNLRK